MANPAYPRWRDWRKCVGENGEKYIDANRRHAAKGVRRLVERRRAMLERGVHKNKANVATARELACWCWAVGRMVENG